MKEIISYLFFGILTSLINYIAFYIFYELVFDTAKPLLANTISFIIATLFAFLTNKKFVFETEDWSLTNTISEGLQFFGYRLMSFAIEQLGLAIANRFIDESIIYFSYNNIQINGIVIAKVVLSFLATLLNYIFAKFLVFKEEG